MHSDVDDHEVRLIRQRIRRHLAAGREVATYIVVVGCLTLIDWATGGGWWVQWVALIWGVFVILGLRGCALGWRPRRTHGATRD